MLQQASDKLEKEIASLKAQLEAKGKKGNASKPENKGSETANAETNAETEGF